MRAAMFWIESVEYYILFLWRLFFPSKLLMLIPICDALDELKSIVMEMVIVTHGMFLVKIRTWLPAIARRGALSRFSFR